MLTKEASCEEEVRGQQLVALGNYLCSCSVIGGRHRVCEFACTQLCTEMVSRLLVHQLLNLVVGFFASGSHGHCDKWCASTLVQFVPR